jgi:hypothetical protein
MQAVKDAGQKFLVMHDNPNSLGTKGWKNLCNNFDNTSRATGTMVLNEFTSNKRESTDADFVEWLSKDLALHDRIRNRGNDLEEGKGARLMSITRSRSEQLRRGRKKRRLSSDPSPPARLLRARSSSSSADERALGGRYLNL